MRHFCRCSQGSDDESESEICPIIPNLPSVSASPSTKHEAGPTSPPPPADTTITAATVDSTTAAAATTATTAAITIVAAAADAVTANGSAVEFNAADVMTESPEDGDGIVEKSGGGVELDGDRGCTEEQPQEDVGGNRTSCDASGVDGSGGGSGEIAEGNEDIVSTGDSSGEGRAMAPCSGGKVKAGHNRRCSGSSSSRNTDVGVGVSGGVGVAPGCHSVPAPRATPVVGIAAAAAAAAANNAVAALAAEKYFSMFSRRDPQVAATTAVARSTPPPGVAPAGGKVEVSSARAPRDSDDNEMEED